MEARSKGCENALLQLPLAIVQRTNVPRFQPSRNAVEVEGVLANLSQPSTIRTSLQEAYITDAPRGVTFFARR